MVDLRGVNIERLQKIEKNRKVLNETIIEYLRGGNISDELALAIADALENPPGRGAKPTAQHMHIALAREVVDALEEGRNRMAAYSLAAERYSATDEPVSEGVAADAYELYGHAIETMREVERENREHANKNKESPE